MKKVISLLIAGLTISALVVGGCGSKPAEGDNATSPNTAVDKAGSTAPDKGTTPNTATPPTSAGGNSATAGGTPPATTAGGK